MTRTATLTPTVVHAPCNDVALRLRARGRATGALVVGSFAAWWVAAGLSRANCPAWCWAVLAAAFVAVAATALRVLRAHPAVEDALPADMAQRKRRSGRIFLWTCVAEVAGILVGVNVAAGLGHADWQPAVVMTVVGLHFLPLANGFGYRPHLVTGVVLTVWALAYPALLAGGAMAPAGFVGGGAILFASAAWALRSVRA